ncbi:MULTISPECIES: methyltransferase domain-containing protein [unclassified Microcoleus]|uniref:methyltransferase domain-containing protein n=1 Tax=unclassified Microcoleus TaxID=2642155 RepID=UPI0025F2BF14|nr:MULTISPECIES: methyltransferase domain-containing protein [unclassified Microcoleus]
MKYEVIIYWSDEDQAFIAEVPELPGCAADGETYQEAVQNVEIIMQQWIETAQEIGRSVPQPKGRLRIKDMSLVELLNPQKNEHILDLGCGEGELTKEIADKRVARVVGIDICDSRKDSCNNFQFEIRNATDLGFNEEFDAVFSHHVIHLIKPPEQVISSVWNALKPGGRFVAEFYGHGTAKEIILALQEVMSPQNSSFDINKDFPWYLPTQEEYCNLLTSQGFTVIVNRIFPKKLYVVDIRSWTGNLVLNIKRFRDMDDENRQKIFKAVENQVRSQLFDGSRWFVNHQHIRIVAIKSSQLSNNN